MKICTKDKKINIHSKLMKNNLEHHLYFEEYLKLSKTKAQRTRSRCNYKTIAYQIQFAIKLQRFPAHGTLSGCKSMQLWISRE